MVVYCTYAVYTRWIQDTALRVSFAFRLVTTPVTLPATFVTYIVIYIDHLMSIDVVIAILLMLTF